MTPAWATIGYQWSCLDQDCLDGSHGGFDGSRPTIKAEFEKVAKDHAKATGHTTQVDRMQSVRFTIEGGAR